MHGGDEAAPDGPTLASTRRVRRHAREVALGATGLALAVYVVVGVVADLVVLAHLQGAVDARLRTRLAALVRARPAAVAPARPAVLPRPPSADEGGLDDAPVLAWWVPSGTAAPVPLDADGLRLPRRAAHLGGPVDVALAGRTFRAVSAPVHGGRYAVATSIQELGSIRATLVTAESALLPFVLVTFFLVAYAIGRRAATPVERARTQQLDFTADASHELRTPLSVIEAEVGLALSADRDATALRGALGRIGAESRRLGGIVDDLLWLARADGLPAGAPPGGAVDLAVLAEDAVARFAPVAAHRRLQLLLDADPARRAVVGVPADWLDRLLSVLLDNACRYGEPGGTVCVRVGAGLGRCLLSVDDSGPGIPPQALPGIFRRFHRATGVPGGAGLGLAIADTIVRSTGGRWEVGRSDEGGTRMGVSWPSAVVHHPARGPRARREPDGG